MAGIADPQLLEGGAGMANAMPGRRPPTGGQVPGGGGSGGFKLLGARKATVIALLGVLMGAAAYAIPYYLL